MTVIAMTREMGTRGKEVARHLAERLESRLVYHELINDPPDPEGLVRPSEVTRHLGDGAEGPARPKRASGQNDRMTPVELLELASRGNVIIRGWGIVRLLHGIPHVFCLRVCAPMEARLAEMMRRLGVSEGKARQEIERSDALHSNVLQRLFGDDWRDVLNYDLVVNTARMPPADCADLVIDAISRPAFAETDESQQAMADRLMEARIASFLAHDPGLRTVARNVYVTASGGAVTLYGGVHGASTAHEIAKAVRAQLGTETIRNEIHAVRNP